MKLHLGCGERYLDGYINIDYPPSQHTVQTKDVADIHADILNLKYPKESIDEIRLHHVFEHFSRPISCTLLASWYSWLKPHGIIHIEVPDFEQTVKIIFKRFKSDNEKNIAIRHIFGSHEADWAIHYVGYTPQSLKEFLERYGFKAHKIFKNSYKSTYNFEIIAEKVMLNFNTIDFEKITTNYLNSFLIDNSETEKRLLSAWLNIYKLHIEKTWGTENLISRS